MTPWTRRARTGAAPSVYTGLELELAVDCPDRSDPRSVNSYAAAAKLAEARSGGFGVADARHSDPAEQASGRIAEWQLDVRFPNRHANEFP